MLFRIFYELLGVPSLALPSENFFQPLILPYSLPSDILKQLDNPITSEEIKSAMFSIDLSKLLGPDCFFFFSLSLVGNNSLNND